MRNPGNSTRPSRHRKRCERYAYIQEKRDQPCADCGKSYPICCMDFHHIGDKDPVLIGVSTATRMMDWSIKRIDAELAKCVVLCSNCHRIRHA